MWSVVWGVALPCHLLRGNEVGRLRMVEDDFFGGLVVGNFLPLLSALHAAP